MRDQRWGNEPRHSASLCMVKCSQSGSRFLGAADDVACPSMQLMFMCFRPRLSPVLRQPSLRLDERKSSFQTDGAKEVMVGSRVSGFGAHKRGTPGGRQVLFDLRWRWHPLERCSPKQDDSSDARC